MVKVVMPHNTSSESLVAVDGSVLFIIDQLESYNESMMNSWAIGGLLPTSAHAVPVNLSSIPTLKFPSGDVFGFLMCSPHAFIQTRQVRATGNGNLTLGIPQPSQGNIDLLQANYALSLVLTYLPFSSGPTTNYGQLGTDLILRLFFGNQSQSSPGPKIYEFAPPANITAMYKHIVHSAMKPFLSGGITTENVPGGFTEEKVVFKSSLGHVLASTILFALLAIAMLMAQVRERRAAFTFVNVAAALADSDMPQKCVEMEQFNLKAGPGMGKRKVLKLIPSVDGKPYCAYQSID